MKAEFIILIFYCAINIAQYVVVRESGVYISDALGVPLHASEGEQFGILCASLILCIIGYLFYRFLILCGLRKNSGVRDFRRVRSGLIAGLVMTFFGFVAFDYGRAETQSSLAFGFLFRVIPVDLLFAFYLCMLPLKNVRSDPLVFSYLILKVWMGWTGMISGVFWTLFVRLVNANQHRKYINFYALGLLVLAFAVGPMVYAVKFYFRWGVADVAYLEALTRLIGRIGFYSNALYIWENSSQFAAHVKSNLSGFSYIKDAFVAVLPRSLLGLQGENIETVFVSFVTGSFAPGITFYLGLLGKSISYFYQSPIDMFLMVMVAFSLLFASIRLTQATIGRSAGPIMITGIFQVLLSGSIEEISYGVYAALLAYLICKVRWFPQATRRNCSQSAQCSSDQVL